MAGGNKAFGYLWPEWERVGRAVFDETRYNINSLSQATGDCSCAEWLRGQHPQDQVIQQ